MPPSLSGVSVPVENKNATRTTAANAPYSNGIQERNHAIVDLTMKKIKAGVSNISDQEALEYALMVKNIETNDKGFSNCIWIKS